MGLPLFWRIRVLWLFLYLSPLLDGIELTDKTRDYLALFEEIAEDFDNDQVGCSDRSVPVNVYKWRGVGYGSNVNLMILPWLDAVLNGHNDIVLLLDDEGGHFDLVKCLGASNGVEAGGGFSCLFVPMPHVCAFNTKKDWENFMVEQNVSSAEREYALIHDTLEDSLKVTPNILRQLQGSGIDILTAKAVLLDYMHSHWQSWAKRDMQSILDEPMIEALKDGPYLGIHIRRGDKLISEADLHEVQEYLQKAHSYIQNSTEASISIDGIRGIWVSYNDEDVLLEVKRSIADYFPNIDLERVMGISNRAFSINKASGDAFPTTSNGMVRWMETKQ